MYKSCVLREHQNHFKKIFVVLYNLSLPKNVQVSLLCYSVHYKIESTIAYMPWYSAQMINQQKWSGISYLE